MNNIEEQVKETIDELLMEMGYKCLVNTIMTNPNDSIKIFEMAKRIEQREIFLLEHYSSRIIQEVTNESNES